MTAAAAAAAGAAAAAAAAAASSGGVNGLEKIDVLSEAAREELQRVLFSFFFE